jgi:hypothetical protein
MAADEPQVRVDPDLHQAWYRQAAANGFWMAHPQHEGWMRAAATLDDAVARLRRRAPVSGYCGFDAEGRSLRWASDRRGLWIGVSVPGGPEGDLVPWRELILSLRGDLGSPVQEVLW